MNTVFSAKDLTRTFRSGKSEIKAVDNVSFTIEPGEILTIVGLNGAGKTTLLRMCSTLLEPTSGTLFINGIDACSQPYVARRNLGLSFGGDRGFYPKATVEENLLFFADLAEVPNQARHREVSRVLSLVNLEAKASSMASTLSRGQYQRLHIARALLGEPKLLILDEPTNGLDPNVALRLRSLIASIAATGTAILMSSHSMEEVAELANHVLLMRSSKIIAHGGIADIVASASLNQITETILPADAQIDIELLLNIEGISYIHRRPSGSKWLLKAYWNSYSDQVEEEYLSALKISRLQTSRIHRHREADLQDAFLFLSREDSE